MVPSMRGRLARGAALVAASCAAALLGCGAPSGRSAGDHVTAAAGGEAATTNAARAAGPAATAPVSFADVAGIQAELSRHRGHPVVLNFWATWCGPCVEELPDLALLARDFDGKGPDFIGVSLDGWVFGSDSEAEEKVRGALKESGVAYVNLIYRGDQDTLLEGFKLPGPIPYSVLYDRDGREVKTWAGRVRPGELREEIARLRS
jgi:thiol-disulfide isomerase/thioredoxin